MCLKARPETRLAMASPRRDLPKSAAEFDHNRRIWKIFTEVLRYRNSCFNLYFSKNPIQKKNFGFYLLIVLTEVFFQGHK
jgi:hypothetical protein